MNEIIITKHSEKRVKQRLGQNKKNSNKIAMKAMLNGIKYLDISNKRLKKYISKLYESHNKIANNIIIYNRDIFIFRDITLITIFHLPQEYCVIADKIQKRKKEEEKKKEGIINGS